MSKHRRRRIARARRAARKWGKLHCFGGNWYRVRWENHICVIRASGSETAPGYPVTANHDYKS
jgi:hypothetical protein